MINKAKNSIVYPTFEGQTLFRSQIQLVFYQSFINHLVIYQFGHFLKNGGPEGCPWPWIIFEDLIFAKSHESKADGEEMTITQLEKRYGSIWNSLKTHLWIQNSLRRYKTNRECLANRHMIVSFGNNSYIFELLETSRNFKMRTDPAVHESLHTNFKNGAIRQSIDLCNPIKNC